jgi:hypothetical protein
MKQTDHFSLARTGENTTPRSDDYDQIERRSTDLHRMDTPKSSEISPSISETSSTLGRLMEYV